MQLNRKAIKYAKAVYDIAQKSDSIEKTFAYLQLIYSIYNTSPEFRFFLHSKRISSENKKEILKEVFSNFVSLLEIDLFACLIDNDDIHLLILVIKQFYNIHRLDDKSIKVVVTTANKMHSDEKNEILNLIEKQINKRVDIIDTIEPEIIGGAKLRIGNLIIDGSISNRLKKLEKSLIER